MKSSKRSPLQASSTYGIVLPSVNVRYAASPNTNVRIAATRSLARPDYYNIVPYRAQDDNAATIGLGNADLAPTTSWNFDALAEMQIPQARVVRDGSLSNIPATDVVPGDLVAVESGDIVVAANGEAIAEFAPLEELLDLAVERRDRVAEHRRAGGKREPGGVGIPVSALDTATAGEPLGDGYVLRPQDVHGKGAMAYEDRP